MSPPDISPLAILRRAAELRHGYRTGDFDLHKIRRDPAPPRPSPPRFRAASRVHRLARCRSCRRRDARRAPPRRSSSSTPKAALVPIRTHPLDRLRGGGPRPPADAARAAAGSPADCGSAIRRSSQCRPVLGAGDDRDDSRQRQGHADRARVRGARARARAPPDRRHDRASRSALRPGSSFLQSCRCPFHLSWHAH